MIDDIRPPATAHRGIHLVFSDQMDRFRNRSAVPAGVTLGTGRGAALCWPVDDSTGHILTAVHCSDTCEGSGSLLDDSARQLALLVEQLRPRTVELDLACLWRSPVTASVLAARLALDAQAVVVGDTTHQLTTAEDRAAWRRFAAALHRRAVTERQPPHSPQGAQRAIDLQAA